MRKRDNANLDLRTWIPQKYPCCCHRRYIYREREKEREQKEKGKRPGGFGDILAVPVEDVLTVDLVLLPHRPVDLKTRHFGHLNKEKLPIEAQK